MSQQGGYYYQNYADPNNPLKSRPPTMVNGQPVSSQQVQNGIQPPHFNLAGTPSSQSSREPSRETSRDPSPTQYLHGQYRPQLPRPPMPPINGQQNSSPNIMPPPPRMTQAQQYGPSTIPYNAHTAQFNSNTTNSSPATSASNALPGIVPLPSNMPQLQLPTSQATSQIQQSGINKNLLTEPGTESVKTEQHNPGQSYQWTPTTQHANLSVASSNTSAPSNNTDSARSISQTSPTGHALPIGQTHPSNQMSKTIPDKGQTTTSVAPVQQTQSMNWPLNQSSNQPNQDASAASIGPPRNAPQHMKPESQVTSPPSLPGVPPTHPPQQIFGSQQNIFSNTTSSTQSVPTFAPTTNATTQNVFNNQSNPQSTQNQAMPDSRQHGVVQETFPSQGIPQAQYPLQPPSTVGQVQQNVHGGQKDLPPVGPTPPQTQNFYSSQPNLASQMKYPQTSYGAHAPPPSTANLSSPEMPSPRPPMPPTANPGQLRSPTGMPPLPGQQIQNPYDPRMMYPGQMSNVPLDSMTKRYPASYPDQMNQLNNQMTNMSVNQGFNKAWGMRCVDLLQCRNVLPPGRVEPPEIRLHQEFLDSINCSPDIFRCTLTKIPDSNSLLQKSRLPLGVLIHPFKDLNHLPVIQCRTIVRCRVCRTYINPFVYFVDSKRWKCNLCYRLNDLPEEFQFDPVTKSYGDPSRRPEVKNSTIEFIAPSEYMLRPPQPAVYLFILDVSRLAVESGYLTVVCNTIAEELTRLPGDGRTQVGFLAIDSAIHFFSMPDNVSQPHEMIMLDVEDVFLPCPENLVVNLKEREELIRDLLAQLPSKFEGTHDTNNALGAGLQVAFKLMSPTGGRVTVFQTCLPNLGPGLLQAREDPNSRASKDVPHLNPATDFYKRLALDCSGQQIAVDLFLLNSQYCDLATLSGMCKFSGGCIYHLPLFRASKFQCNEMLERMLRRYLARKIGFEAVMRIRCTRGLSIHTFHGNFFVRSTDLLSLPNVNPDTGFGMQITIEESLADIQNVCFQAALLYTSSKGERRIRVHTLCLPVVTSLSDILHSADQQCIIGLLSKMAVDRSQQSSLSDARDALINVAIDVLSAYKVSQSVGPTGLLVPGNLDLLPLYIIALLKCMAFRSGTSTRLDDRVFAMCQLKTLPLTQLIQMVYPDLYPIHALDDRNSKDIDGKVCPQPPRLHLSAEKLDSRGAFLMDAGDKIFIYVGKNIHPTFCCNVLGVSAFQAIHEEFYELPELDTAESERLRNFVFSLQEEKPYYASVQIIRDDSHFRTLFVERLIEDRFESALSYYEFLQHLKTQVK